MPADENKLKCFQYNIFSGLLNICESDWKIHYNGGATCSVPVAFKNFSFTNTLAYFPSPSVTKKKNRVITLMPADKNKLECLPLQTL